MGFIDLLLQISDIVLSGANPVNSLRMHKRSVYHIKFRMKMLFLYSRSRCFFTKFLYVRGRAGRVLINFFGRLADAICFFLKVIDHIVR